MPTDILPNCIAMRNEKSVVWANGVTMLQLFCANCGKESGLVMQTDYDRVKNFAFSICIPCAEKWSPMVGVGLVPDEVFWSKLHEAQMEAFGRDLTEEEIVEALQDDSHILSKLCKDRYDLATIKS